MSKSIILTKEAPAPIGPYNQAVMAGDTLYVSGQIALDPDGNVIEGGIQKETDHVMKNIGKILEAADMDYSNIVKCTIFIKDMTQFSEINAAYGEYFPENAPARETVEISRLPKDVNVEISCIAVR
mgnify:CR=1 FL=1